MNLDDRLDAAALAIREPQHRGHRAFERVYERLANTHALQELNDDVELTGALERAYRAAEQAEQLGNQVDAATYFRVAADQNIGDAAVRLANVLTELGETEANEWYAAAAQEGFTTTRPETGTAVPRPPEPTEDEPLSRQRFLAHAAAVTVGVTQLPLRGAGRLGDHDVLQIEAATRALRALDRQYGGIACHAAVLDHVRALEPLLGSRDQRLNAAIADAYDLAGWTAFDSGKPAAAHAHFATAMSLAGENTALMAGIMSHAGRMYLHDGDPDAALRLFQLGWLHAQNSGDAAAIAKLADLQAQARGGGVPEIDLTALREQKRVRGHTIVLTALARVRMTQGDLHDAIALAGRALDTSDRLRSQRANDHLRALRSEAERHRAAQELADRIAARLARTT